MRVALYVTCLVDQTWPEVGLCAAALRLPHAADGAARFTVKPRWDLED